MSASCPTCGSQNPSGYAVCATCGARLQPVAAAPGPSLRYPGAAETVLIEGGPPPVVAKSPFSIQEGGHVTVPLLPTFRFVHEPVSEVQAVQFVGRQNEIESLAERILFSDGGSFLVTGYRGVGKTSFVNQVIAKLREAARWANPILGETEIVDIHLNIARPVEPSELMHHIIRRLYDRLVGLGIYSRLDAELRDALTLAYQRTSVNMARKLGETTERSFGVSEGSLAGDWMKALLKVSWSSKRTRSSNSEMSFLGYDDKAAEHDIISIAQRLAAGYVKPTTRWQRLRLTLSGEPPGHAGLKILFVFDELDKLEEFTTKGANGEEVPKPVIDEILGALKNLFTTSRVTFVFVAGKDLQERWLEDVGRGDSVYESVFSYDKYLPCLWADVDAICDGLVDRAGGVVGYPAQVFEAFKKYLAYRGRGIPRRIIRTFNEYVEWHGERPALAFTRRDVRRIRFYAGLQNLLDEHEGALFGDAHEETLGTQRDKRRLGVYYLIDWMLRRGAEEFSLEDVLSASSRLSVKIALAEEIAPRVGELVIDMLVAAEYLQLVERSATQAIVGDPAADSDKRYRMAARRLVELRGQGADVDLDGGLGPPSDDFLGRQDRLPATIGRFRVVKEIGRGGMGVVYQAIDERNGRRVAVKVLSERLMTDPALVARFEREARILAALDHDNIVRLYESGADGGRVFLAMEFLDGVTLDEVVRRRGPLSIEVASAITVAVAEAAQYVHEHGFVRNDIKPSNVMLTANGRVCMLDFSISRPSAVDSAESELTQSGMLVGTPQFMAPEQARGAWADERSDVYALGVGLYWLITGRYPFEGSNPADIMQAHLNQRPEAPSMRGQVSAVLDAIVLRCLEKDAAQRFQSMAELAEALKKATVDMPAVEAADLEALVRLVREVAKEVAELDHMRTIERTVESPTRRMTGPVPQMMAAAPAPPVVQTMAASPATPIAQTMAAPPPPVSAPPPVKSAKGGWWAPKSAPAPPPIQQPAASSPFAARRPLPPPPAHGDPLRAMFAQRKRAATPELDTDPRAQLLLVVGGAGSIGTRLDVLGGAYMLEGKTTLGRSSENDIVLRGLSVSRYHAQLSREGDEWFIEDANSGPGTFVNGERVLQRRPLRDDDEIRVAEFTFLFRGSRPGASAGTRLDPPGAPAVTLPPTAPPTLPASPASP